MELWFTEQQTDNVRFSCRVKETIYAGRSAFQEIALYDTVEFGRMLVLDGYVQTTVRDEFVYHEMIAHVPLFTHPDPKRVLVIGGGDGGTVREVLKHRTVTEVTMVEIDAEVVSVCHRYLPETSGQLHDPRVAVIATDGIRFVREAKEKYDVIIIDSSEPVGPGAGLFTREFYQSVHDALGEEGVMVAQTESPFCNADLISQVFAAVKGVFPVAMLYTAHVPTYPSGMWTFTLGSKGRDPRQGDAARLPGLATRYYTPALQQGAFMLPRLVADLLK